MSISFIVNKFSHLQVNLIYHFVQKTFINFSQLVIDKSLTFYNIVFEEGSHNKTKTIIIDQIYVLHLKPFYDSL